MARNMPSFSSLVFLKDGQANFIPGFWEAPDLTVAFIQDDFLLKKKKKSIYLFGYAGS